LLVSKSIEGGAGGASYQLHKSLQGVGVTSRLLLEEKPSSLEDPTVILGVKSRIARYVNQSYKKRLQDLLLKPYRNRHIMTNNFDLFSPQWLWDSIPILQVAAKLRPDVINLHWVCDGGVRIESIPRLRTALVWTLHDMWAFTGGCHQSLYCNRYRENCGACPQLHSGKDKDASRWIWARKAKAWKDLNLTIVTPSLWLAKCAKSSSLFRDLRVEVIPNGVDEKQFYPIEQERARDYFHLPHDKFVVLFGAWANTSNKGFQQFQQAVGRLNSSELKAETQVVVFGAYSQTEDDRDLLVQPRYLGTLGHNIMPLAYSAADVFVVPSFRENFPLTVLESLACGTPVVAFDITGPREIILHKKTGYLAKAYEIDDLSCGIEWVLENKSRRRQLAREAREHILKQYTLEQIAHRYLTLFDSVC
jgi:glycosyltransferase involved in cell wall biosynthesis